LRKKVVVVGGGYGGLRAIEFLAKQSDLDVTLIDKSPYHYLQTEAYGYIAGRFDIHDVAIDYKQWCQGFGANLSYIQARVQSVDFEAQSVATCHETIPYDYLILAMGAQTNFFSFIEGLKEHSYGVKSLFRAHSFRTGFEELIYKKLQNDATLADKKINLAIGGAGLSGVEVAAEMANVIETYAKTIGTRAKDIQIYLIDASETILPGMSEYVIKNTHKRLEAIGVEILTTAFIERLDAEYIYFKNGEKLAYRFMVFTGGIKASKLNATLDVAKNRMDQFIADAYLNIASKENVFAIGDCVELSDNKGQMLPPTAQSAERSAEYVAHAIRAKIDGKKVLPFSASMMGMFIALGGKYAVGEMFGVIKVKGYMAFLLKKAITHAYYLGLHFRINVGYKNRGNSQNH
jgi:NADH dehydrogenase